MRYRRAYQKGGCCFFTVVTARRRPILASANAVDFLRDSFRHVKTRYLFTLDAIVILPDHLHCVWQLPDNDGDFSIRWRLVKTFFSKHAGHPRPCWQSRFWEHLIRDDDDYSRHIDYIHYNPVKHDYVDRPADWRYSSFCRFVRGGFYSPDRGATAPDLPANIGRE